MLDFCVGLDTEFSEVVEGSHLYFPKTLFSQVHVYTCITCLHFDPLVSALCSLIIMDELYIVNACLQFIGCPQQGTKISNNGHSQQL